jgi:DNA-directed RNA polymerase subunit L
MVKLILRGGKMQVKILENKKNELKVELTGETYTISKAIQDVLLQDKAVELAVADIDHPLVGNPVLIVKGKNPKLSLKKALKTLKKDFSDVEKAFRRTT